jgi:putative endonuclease
MSITADRQGRLAETEACTFLKNKGYKLLACRYKTPYGEIDLLMVKDKTIIAVEVKYRRTLKTAAESISSRQKERIQNALSCFLEQHSELAIEYPFIQFDVVLLCISKAIVHISNAWQIEDDFL